MGDVERKINDLRRLMDFKKFDSVQDFSDHHYLRQSSEERVIYRMQQLWVFLVNFLLMCSLIETAAFNFMVGENSRWVEVVGVGLAR